MTRRSAPNSKLTRPAKNAAGQLARPENRAPGLPAPFPYFGGKQRIAASIVDLLPVHELYLEPYFGSGSLLLAKQPSAVEIVNDLDGALATFWRILREQSAQLERLCRLTPHSRTELQLARQTVTDMGANEIYSESKTRSEREMGSDASPVVDLEIARCVFVQLTQGRGATLGGNTGWRHYRSGFSMAKALQGYADRLAPIASRLAEVSIECRDAIDIITDFGADPKALIVADPPYPLNARSVKHSGGRYHQEADQEHHHRLAEALHIIAGKAIVFTYPNPLYDALYGSWERVDIPATKQSAQQATEVAYLNYEPPCEPSLLDYLPGDGHE